VALLEEVAPLAALHLVRHFAGDVERRQEAEMVRAVLAGRVPASSLAHHLDVRANQRVMVLGLSPVCADEVEVAMHLGRLSSVVALFRRTEHLQLAQTTSGSTLHVVLVGGDRLDPTVVDLVQRARSSVKVSTTCWPHARPKRGTWSNWSMCSVRWPWPVGAASQRGKPICVSAVSTCW
jgi:hypothetical protein